MTKANIPQYSATAASNTDVQDIDIAENCAPSGINNAIREIMADLKDQDTGAVAMTSPVATSLTVTNEITANGGIALGDNDKATFGDGDLEIYHNASDSFVSAVGTGDLIIQTSTDDKDVKIKSDDGAGGLAEYFRADGSVGQAQMFYYGSKKLNTTNSGIDVTGTATMDGLTVDGAYPLVTLNDTRSVNDWEDGDVVGELKFTTDDAGMTNPIASIRAVHNRAGTGHSSNDAGLEFYGSATTTGTIAKRMSIESVTGNISFYEDTGSDVKFFWDASAEALGIGTTSPQTLLHLTDNSNGAKLRLQGNGGNAADTLLGSLEYFNNDGSEDTPAVVSSINSYSSNANGTGGYLTLSTHDGTEGGEGSSAVERMRIDSSGNVGIGTSSASDLLDISANGTSAMRLSDSSSPATYAQFTQANGVLTFAADAGNAQTGSNMQFEVDGTEAMRIDASGHAIIPAGVTLGTAAGVYSANNTLDDYEEGSYTVQLFDASSGGNASSSSTTGYYTKVGNQVTVRFDALNNISTTGMTGANDAYFTLPFAAGSTGRAVGSVIMDNLAFTTNRNVVAPVVFDSASRAVLITTGGSVTDVNVEVQDINSGSTDIHTYTLTYFTA